jgi:hypothetical protein
MSAPRDFSQEELARFSLGAIQRRAPSGEAVIRVYCLRCGRQVNFEDREADPGGWWACARGCNTQYAGASPRPHPLSPTGTT